MRIVYWLAAFNFNSRPSARGDTARRTAASACRISIHAPPRGATAELHQPVKRHNISIHAPPRGATREARGQRRREKISIHAPPRGATDMSVWIEQSDTISIHAPPRGATHGAVKRPRRDVFQFTPLREGRPDGLH